MLTGKFTEEDLSPHAACHNQSCPTSPTYTSSYSAPSPYSSSSSPSYPARSPLSEPFESPPDLVHPPSMGSYPNPYAHLSHSSYNELEYSDVDYTNWPLSDVTVATKGHPPLQHPPQHPHHFQHHTHPIYHTGPSHSIQAADFDRLKTSELYISPTSPTIYHHHLPSPGVIHAPVPIPVLSSSYHPSPSPSTSLPAPHPPYTHPLRGVSQQHHPDDCYFSLDTVTHQWRPGSADAHHAQYSTIYPKSQSHPLRQTYPASGFASQTHGSVDLMADYSSAVDVTVRSTGTGRRIKQEEIDIYSDVAPLHHSQTRGQIFDLGGPRTAASEVPGTSAQHASSSSSMSPYFSHTAPCESASASPDLNLSNLHIQDGQVYATTAATIAAALPSSSAASSHSLGPSRSGFDAQPVSETARNGPYIGETTPQTADGRPAYTPVESGYADHYVMSRQVGPKEMWHAEGRPCADNNEYAHEGEADADQDAEGEDDPDGYASHYAVQEPSPATPDLRRKLLQHHASQAAVIKEEEDADEEEQEDAWQERATTGSEGDIREEDDHRDPDFVPSTTRPRRHTYTSSSSYMRVERGRNLRSTSRARYNPYPTASSNAPTTRTGESSFTVTDGGTGDTPTTTPTHRRRGSYSHLHVRTSLSPSSQHSQASDSYSPLSTGSCTLGSPTTSFSLPSTSATPLKPSTSTPVQQQRRRVGPHAGGASIPIPVPVPNLTKKSRGRRVPTLEDLQVPVEEWPAFGVRRKAPGGSGTGGGKTGIRTYTCGVDGCGKLFARGEHLKRHIRSIHTYEKRTWFFLFFFSIDHWLTLFFLFSFGFSASVSVPWLWQGFQSA